MLIEAFFSSPNWPSSLSHLGQNLRCAREAKIYLGFSEETVLIPELLEENLKCL